MSLVRSILPPPDQLPAIIANGCTLAGTAGMTSSASGDWTCPSGIRSYCAAAGPNADANTKAAAPQISFKVMALAPLLKCLACIGAFGKPLGSTPIEPNPGLVNPCSLNPWPEQYRRQQFALKQPA